MITAFLRYLFSAKNEHSIHSPFVFELYTKVIRNSVDKSVFQEIEAIRSEMKSSTLEIEVVDYGAGSRLSNTPLRKVSTIAKNAQKTPKFSQLLYRLIQYFQPTVLFDLGTSLGITTLYEAKAAPEAQIYSFEGCPQTAQVAAKNLQKLQASKVELVIGNLDETLVTQAQQVSQIDFAFFDANHRYEPTVRYFLQCLKKAHQDSVFVFDDIHWSPEMGKAWIEIQAHPSVTVTIDLFFVGLVFFGNKQPKQHFVLRF
ncbi:O-methyltransferase [Siphonobacter sp. SORGH_AS_1065]|uniref:O-methyltransferase n=1 Tax=Siphonobacter sp. SORGH_AS_1065 TaxID=3041795 RepID=UPI00278A94A4|nr:class I SAM-dependent methyltransferase [Siphonobacter sp. SORGH_AS_1065]MDQ1086321.1 putative O-methyltransferase YrrM [Siphonobacter sp. SORGH_AS_1065]